MTVKIAAKIYDGMFPGECEAVVCIDKHDVSVLVDQRDTEEGFLRVTVLERKGDQAFIDLSGEPFQGTRRRFVPVDMLHLGSND